MISAEKYRGRGPYVIRWTSLQFTKLAQACVKMIQSQRIQSEDNKSQTPTNPSSDGLEMREVKVRKISLNNRGLLPPTKANKHKHNLRKPQYEIVRN